MAGDSPVPDVFGVAAMTMRCAPALWRCSSSARGISPTTPSPAPTVWSACAVARIAAELRARLAALNERKRALAHRASLLRPATASIPTCRRAGPARPRRGPPDEVIVLKRPTLRPTPELRAPIGADRPRAGRLAPGLQRRSERAPLSGRGIEEPSCYASRRRRRLPAAGRPSSRHDALRPATALEQARAKDESCSNSTARCCSSAASRSAPASFTASA